MDLKNFLSAKEGKSNEYYWSLVIEPEWVQAGIWEIERDKARVISVSPSVAWGPEEELVGACDTVLSAAVSSFPKDAKEPSKTVFGVSSTWVSEGQIKAKYLEIFKRICSDLSLTPVGFVILPEVMAHLIKSEEGAPLSGVVLGIGSENIEVSIFRLGNLVGTANVARSVSIVDDVAEGLTRFAGGEAFPSRFLLYDGKEGELEEVKQALLKAQWDDYEKIKFLHTPKIETVSPKRKVQAVSLAGASEIADVSVLAEPGKREPEKEEKETKAAEETLTVPEGKVRPEDVGFVVGQDVSVVQQEKAEVRTAEVPTTRVQEKKPSSVLKKGLLSGILSKIKINISSLRSKIIMKPNLKGVSGKRALVIGGGFFLLILLIGFILWWYLPRATVTVYVSPKKLDEKVTILIDPNASSPDFVRGILPGEIVETTVSGEKTKSTTGTKTVGEKARGTVEIRNGTPNSIKLTAGTILLTDNDLKFTLDSSASVSAQVVPGSPGTAQIEATAADIGSEYNLGKDTTSQVGNYLKAEVAAVATSDFTGGSSRQIAAVSADDQEELEDDLTEELLEKARNELADEATEDQFFVEASIMATPATKSFSAKVDDEVDNLRLSLSLETTGFVVDNVAFLDFAKEVLKDRVPSGYVLREDQIDMRFEFEGEEEDDIYEVTVYLDVNLLPDVRPDEIAEKIAGRYLPLAEDYLTTIAGFTRAEINLKPKLPGRLGTLPHVVSKIEVELAAER
ncbi:MAG: hypothetical protein WBD86_01095 [Microgenomates group bacterium]